MRDWEWDYLTLQFLQIYFWFSWRTICLANCPALFKHVFRRRYVDDTLVLFSDKSHAPMYLLNYLNQQHYNIHFTIETESDHSISFLVVSVIGMQMTFQPVCLENQHFLD